MPLDVKESKVVEETGLLEEELLQRKRAEEVLRESEEKLRAQYKSIPVPTYTWQRVGEDFVLADYNDAAEAITHGNVADFVGRRASEMYRDRPDILEDLSQCSTEKTILKREMEYRFATTGESKHLAVTYAFVPPDLVMVHTEDITERKRAEEALRQSEKRFREFVENANDIIYTHDMEGNFTSVNPAATRIYGYTLEEALQLNIADVVDPQYLPLAKQKIQEKLEGSPRTESYQLLTYTKEGEPIWVEVSTRLIEREGQPAEVQGIARDISERKWTEEALKESEERYRSIVENSHAGIIIVDDAYRFTYVNDELCRILGYPRQEILGQDFRQFLDEESRKLVAERYVRRQRGEQVPPRYEFNIVRKGGEKRRVEISSTVIKDAAGKVKTVAQILDITERKRAEEETQRYLGRLEALREIDRAISSSLNLTEVLSIVFEQLDKVIHYTSAAIFLLTDGTAKVTTARGFPDLEQAMQVSFSVKDDALAQQLLEEKQPLVLADAQADERFQARGERNTSVLG